MRNGRVLFIANDSAMMDLTRCQLEEDNYLVVSAESGVTALQLAGEQSFDLILTDLQLPDMDGIELIRKLHLIVPTTEIILITGFRSVSKAIEAIKAGAFYVIEKPIEFEKLRTFIETAIEHRLQAEEVSQPRSRLQSRDSYFNLIGASKAMQNVYETIENVAESDANILIIGESGTGKELIANAIHDRSLRAKRPFVKINCSALPKELIESELFGHTKGAFTGAASDKQGLIAQAADSSLLLDEIGEMPIELQPKLLRVLQERIYYRVGSEKALQANFRLIAATNRDPQRAIAEGQLREDLYYRINTIEIYVPPLRNRIEDIQNLAEYFLKLYADKYERPVQSISQQVYETMFAYSWPGNVRELQNIIERAVLLCKGETIMTSVLPLWQQTSTLRKNLPTRTSLRVEGKVTVNVEPSLPATEEFFYKQQERSIINKILETPRDTRRTDIFEKLEGELVAAALERTKGNKKAAATLLGVYQPRFYYLLRKHKLDQPNRINTVSTYERSLTGN